MSAAASRSRLRGARLYQAGFVGVDDRLHAVADAEFPEQVGDVGLYRRLAEEQRGADLGVRSAARDQIEHLALAAGEFVELGLLFWLRAANEAFDHPPRHGLG